MQPRLIADTQWVSVPQQQGRDIEQHQDSGRQRWSKAGGALGVYQVLCVLKTLEEDSQRLRVMGMGLRMSL